MTWFRFLFAQIWSQKIVLVGFSSTRCYTSLHNSSHYMQFQEKLMNQTSENDKNSSFRHNFSPFGPNSGSQIFFSKIWLDQLLDIKVSYHHVKYQTKLMMQSWENLVTIGPTDGQTDESDFTWHCLANVERPIVNRKIDSQNPKYSF